MKWFLICLFFVGNLFAGGVANEPPQSVKLVQQVVVEATRKEANQQILWKMFDMFVNLENILLVLFLCAIGVVLKTIKKQAKDLFPDWGIVFIIPLILGPGFGVGWLSLTLHKQFIIASLMIGVCDGVIAVFAHQMLKQTLESPVGKGLESKWPTITALAAVLTGADMAKHAPTGVVGTGTGSGTSSAKLSDK